MTESINYAYHAYKGRLTVDEVIFMFIDNLLHDIYNGDLVLGNACGYCSPEVVDAILKRGIDVNQADESVRVTNIFSSTGHARITLANA
jgi:hypothetical protein